MVGGAEILRAVAVHFHPFGAAPPPPRRSVCRRVKVRRTGRPGTVYAEHPPPHILSRVGGQRDTPRRNRDAGKNQDRDLYKVFKTLIDEVVVHPDGTVDITYTFENPEG